MFSKKAMKNPTGGQTTSPGLHASFRNVSLQQNYLLPKVNDDSKRFKSRDSQENFPSFEMT